MKQTYLKLPPTIIELVFEDRIYINSLYLKGGKSTERMSQDPRKKVVLLFNRGPELPKGEAEVD